MRTHLCFAAADSVAAVITRRQKLSPPRSKHKALFSLEVNWSRDSRTSRLLSCKKCFHDTFAMWLYVDPPEKPLHESVKTVEPYLRGFSPKVRQQNRFTQPTPGPGPTDCAAVSLVGSDHQSRASTLVHRVDLGAVAKHQLKSCNVLCKRGSVQRGPAGAESKSGTHQYVLLVKSALVHNKQHGAALQPHLPLASLVLIMETPADSSSLSAATLWPFILHENSWEQFPFQSIICYDVPKWAVNLKARSEGGCRGGTDRAQCRGVKGFPSSWINVLNSSKTSKQSSCPVDKKHIITN